MWWFCLRRARPRSAALALHRRTCRESTDPRAAAAAADQDVARPSPKGWPALPAAFPCSDRSAPRRAATVPARPRSRRRAPCPARYGARLRRLVVQSAVAAVESAAQRVRPVSWRGWPRPARLSRGLVRPPVLRSGVASIRRSAPGQRCVARLAPGRSSTGGGQVHRGCRSRSGGERRPRLRRNRRCPASARPVGSARPELAGESAAAVSAPTSRSSRCRARRSRPAGRRGKARLPWPASAHSLAAAPVQPGSAASETRPRRSHSLRPGLSAPLAGR